MPDLGWLLVRLIQIQSVSGSMISFEEFKGALDDINQ